MSLWIKTLLVLEILQEDVEDPFNVNNKDDIGVVPG